MKLHPPADYSLEPVDGGYRLGAGKGQAKFRAPASTQGLAKIYTVATGEGLLYVGVSSQRMSSRLRYGFTARGRSGYHGYKWKALREPLLLTVWTGSEGDSPLNVRTMETIEAEVAYLCRTRSGQWPIYQHEIHFYPSSAEHREAAGTIYQHAVAHAG